MRKFRLLLPLTALLLCFILSAVAAGYMSLSEGDTGEAVDALKARLYELGYFKTTKFSRAYNATTADRVRQFQKLNGLEETGVADPAMQELLYSDTCKAVNGLEAAEYIYQASLTPTPKPTRDPNATKTPRPTKTPKVDKTPLPVIGPTVEVETPEANADGFLVDPEEEFVYRNEEDGEWV